MPTLFALAQVTPAASTLTVVSDVAGIVIAVAMLVLAILGVIIFLRVNQLLKDVRGAAQRSLGPVSDRASVISDNVEFISQALRTDVEKLNEAVRGLTDRLQFASERMEERIEDFNALMEVVQDEAEEIFLDTASTVRGVREGARTIAAPSRGTRVKDEELEDEELEDEELEDEELEAGDLKAEPAAAGEHGSNGHGG